MSLLLDTHVWIWSQESPEALGPKTTARLLDSATTLHTSPISTLEIARLVALGQVDLDGSVLSWVSDTLEALHAATIEVSHDIAAEAYSLPGEFHRDPADRILVATARLADLTVVTADQRILGYRYVDSLNARR